MRVFWFIPFLVLSCALGCSAESGPVSIPVPFSGSLTADTNVLIAEGSPQSTTDNSIRWPLFNSAGVPFGTLSLFPNTLSNLIVTPIPVDRDRDGVIDSEGEKRDYTIDVRADLVDGTVRSSKNFRCFEFPTDDTHTPSFDVSEVTTEPGAKAVIRQLVCSGNNEQTGELIDSKMFVGGAELPNGDFLFHTQDGSVVFLHGVPSIDAPSAEASGKVVMTLLLQGGGVPQPPQEEFPAGIVAFPVFFPGSDAVVGTSIFFDRVLDVIEFEWVETEADVKFFIGSSSLTIRNATGLAHAIPELNDTVRELIGTNFPDDPVVKASPDFLTNGIVALNGFAEGQADPINCNPEANEATGIFRDLCEEFGSLTVNFLCYILVDPMTVDEFAVEGVFILQRP